MVWTSVKDSERFGKAYQVYLNMLFRTASYLGQQPKIEKGESRSHRACSNGLCRTASYIGRQSNIRKMPGRKQMINNVFVMSRSSANPRYYVKTTYFIAFPRTSLCPLQDFSVFWPSRSARWSCRPAKSGIW